MDPYDSSKPGGIGILSLTGPAGSITCPEISPVEDSREIGNQELAKRDGNPVACGGRTGNVVDKGCWEYDPSTNAWNSIDSLTEPKYSHSMVQLNENDFLVSGQFRPV